ncbi:hypothetical protein PAXRUDRAFT_141776, partial [Paxillus rubicundulus Ve08.2h10]
EIKWGKHINGTLHWLINAFQELLDAFGFGWCETPGKVEAELAALNQHDIVDMVLTTDSDVLVFGAKCIVRW